MWNLLIYARRKRKSPLAWRMLDREGKSENLCDKKSLESDVVLRLPLQERPKVEKCLAHLLHYPWGEDVPTILKGETERGKEERWGRAQPSNNCKQSRKSNTQQPGVKIEGKGTKVEGEKGNVQLTKVAQASYIKHLLPLPVLVIAHDCKQVSDKNLKKDETNRAGFKDHQSRPSKLRYY